MKSKTYYTKYFRFGMFLPELRRGDPLGTLQVLAALSTFIFFPAVKLSVWQYYNKSKDREEVSVLDCKILGFGLRNNFLKFLFFFPD